MPNLSFDLKDNIVLVTGASRGIGRSIALTLGAEGAKVALTYTGSSPSSEKNALDVCAEIEKLGGQAKAYALNVANEEQVNAVVAQVTKDFGGLDGLVNNAGVAIDQLMMRYKTEDFDQLMSINLRGAFLVTRACLRSIMRSKNPSIVNMSSVVGEMGNAGQSVYSASKAALIGMSKSLAQELAARQVRVNCVAPGFIETDMTGALDEAQKAKIAENIPMAKLGTVEDIAWTTLFLLSPRSRYMTGQVLSVNGGLYM